MISNDGWPVERGRKGLSVWRLNRILSLIQKRIQLLSEIDREIPIVWSTMHMYTTMQLAKLIAIQRKLDPELAGLVCAFHDIYTLLTGQYNDHGVLAEKYIREIIKEYNEIARDELPIITTTEIECIISSAKVHSDKLTKEVNEYSELLKDIDSLDSYLAGTSPGRKSGRIPRINRLFEALNIDHNIE